jgi:hypothetical protein
MLSVTRTELSDAKHACVWATVPHEVEPIYQGGDACIRLRMTYAPIGLKASVDTRIGKFCYKTSLCVAHCVMFRTFSQKLMLAPSARSAKGAADTIDRRMTS